MLISFQLFLVAQNINSTITARNLNSTAQLCHL